MEAWFTDTTGRFAAYGAGAIYYRGTTYTLPKTFYSIESVIPTIRYRTDVVWPMMGTVLNLNTVDIYFGATVLGGGGYPGYHIIGRARA
jgi:hypothetical protein